MRPTHLLSTIIRKAARPSVINSQRLSPLLIGPSSSHAQESFELFTERYVTFFQYSEDLFEVQRGLDNCFAHDLVQLPLIEAALRALRRVNDYVTAVRIFEDIKEKAENKSGLFKRAQAYSGYVIATWYCVLT